MAKFKMQVVKDVPTVKGAGRRPNPEYDTAREFAKGNPGKWCLVHTSESETPEESTRLYANWHSVNRRAKGFDCKCRRKSATAFDVYMLYSPGK